MVYNARVFGINHIFRKRKISFLTVDPVSLTNNVLCVAICIISCVYFLNTREYSAYVDTFWNCTTETLRACIHAVPRDGYASLETLKTNYHCRRL